MSYFRTCPDCGAHLDPGEVCDCRKECLSEIRKLDEHERTVLRMAARLYRLHPDWPPVKCVEKAAASVTSTDGGEVENAATAVSASYDSTKRRRMQDEH